MIYLDSAATTMQKPPEVARAAAYAVGHMASPGRGGHPPAMKAAETAFACRQAAAELFGVSDPERVVFTFNATHGLNIAIRSLVSAGDRVVISGWEHNAVTRPLHGIGAEIVTARAPLFDRAGQLAAFAEAMEGDVKAVICTHISNVFGFILPVEEIAALCRERRIPFLLDASQSAGCLPVRQDQLRAAFIAMPGHKGLYGPQGTGLLICGSDPKPLLEGGTGSASVLQTMPDFLPDRLEAGTHNMPGIAGLLAGLGYVRSRGTEAILRRERSLIRSAVRGLAALSGVRVFAADDPVDQAGVLSFQIAGRDCEEVGEYLGRHGIAVRAGLHCAPTAHQSAGTLETGTVRVSVSDFNTRAEIAQLVRAVAQLTHA
ncbi:aminotransferase class V-fold PLP-dependent enzyme [Intestinimonas massiliensis (ex Afouda et al. 2020)]|uniref:aminotransferase class V-fold PLP-dependent enzyme n=1 Tax=Intestinimonas massiliensis (ex Afouda et al. 2020) TaxID=1673721 RepID=UPI0010320A0F|nr:aminotransferase class V-fold PLP-dependent enzyme [Intestinimonas massiliensis (ex Afouda et al. 2020)]